MIILGLIFEVIWELLSFPYYIWKTNWHTIPYSDQQGFKIVFSCYGILLLIIIVLINV